MLKICLSLAAIVAAVASAVLWFLSAKMPIAYGAFGTFNGPPPMVIQQLNRQARLNRWAAAATGLSALLQAIAAAVPS